MNPRSAGVGQSLRLRPDELMFTFLTICARSTAMLTEYAVVVGFGFLLLWEQRTVAGRRWRLPRLASAADRPAYVVVASLRCIGVRGVRHRTGERDCGRTLATGTLCHEA